MFDQRLIDIVATKDRKKKPKSLDKIFKGAKKTKIPKGTHKMADGTIMSGSKHSKSSKVLKKGTKKGKRSKY